MLVCLLFIFLTLRGQKHPEILGQRRVIHRYNEEDTDFGELAKTACKNLSLTSNKAHIMESNYDDVLKGGTAEIHNSEDFHLP